MLVEKKKKNKDNKTKHINKNISFSFEVINEYFRSNKLILVGGELCDEKPGDRGQTVSS